MVHRQDIGRLRLITKLRETAPRLDEAGTKLTDVLLPCKQCNEVPAPRVWTERIMGSVYLQCAWCGMSTDEGRTVFDAIDAWNQGKPKTFHDPPV